MEKDKRRKEIEKRSKEVFSKFAKSASKDYPYSVSWVAYDKEKDITNEVKIIENGDSQKKEKKKKQS